ncbi:MAG: hypothetical protein IT324_08335 [Anaerolineae bacterium]|nr:hypothetical protein [Anaerolineae bacterium]
MQTVRRLNDKQIVNGGIIFSVLVCLAIILLGNWLLRFPLAPDNGDPFFYEWQLADKNFWARASVWTLFGLHQLAIWATIWYARRTYNTYSETLRRANYWALGVNLLFVVLHYIQTAVFFDAIAMDVPSWTAQFAVALMLIVILAMETPRRGLFFGRKVNFRKAFIDGLKQYHGYFFSFAVIYTFWFHPMFPTWGHLVGFVHVILVMVQGSLMFTRVHLNRRWMFLLEILVLPHAFQVALNQGNGLWPMFLYGFAAIFLLTQMHGLNLRTWVKRAFYAGFVLAVLLTYTTIKKPFMINEVIRIPLIEYAVVFVMYGIFRGGAWASSKFKALRGGSDVAAAGAGD